MTSPEQALLPCPYEVRKGKDGELAIYSTQFNVKVATFARGISNAERTKIGALQSRAATTQAGTRQFFEDDEGDIYELIGSTGEGGYFMRRFANDDRDWIGAEQFGKMKPLYPSQPVAPVVADGFDFSAHLQRQREWSEGTFGPGMRTAGVCDHIRKELCEVEADPSATILPTPGKW